MENRNEHPLFVEFNDTKGYCRLFVGLVFRSFDDVMNVMNVTIVTRDRREIGGTHHGGHGVHGAFTERSFSIINPTPKTLNAQRSTLNTKLSILHSKRPARGSSWRQPACCRDIGVRPCSLTSRQAPRSFRWVQIKNRYSLIAIQKKPILEPFIGTFSIKSLSLFHAKTTRRHTKFFRVA